MYHFFTLILMLGKNDYLSHIVHHSNIQIYTEIICQSQKKLSLFIFCHTDDTIHVMESSFIDNNVKESKQN